MISWIIAVHVSCSGLDFMKDEPKFCVDVTTFSYTTKQDCEAVIAMRGLPYLGVPYDDLFCKMVVRE